MPSDPASTLFVILLESAGAVSSLWPYLVGGLAISALFTGYLQRTRSASPRWSPSSQPAPLAALMGVASPLPTLGVLPLLSQGHTRRLSSGSALAFVLASTMMNPQLFILTFGALGPTFALVQLASVLLISIALGLALASTTRLPGRRAVNEQPPSVTHSVGHTVQFASHVALYALVGVLAGACLHVLLPQTGLMNWLARYEMNSTPVLGWLLAPFYTCGGAAVPAVGGLLSSGISPGAVLVFLLVGPALRGSALASLGYLLPKRRLFVCLAAMLVASSLVGLGFDWFLETL